MTPYTGRFAPSPTGPLHIGSLIGALASYLDARHHGGQWLLRIEDLDPPREQPGAALAIIDCLRAHGLNWDGDIWYQSNRHRAYQQVIDTLLAQQQAFYCTCSRKDLADSGGIYTGHCRSQWQKPSVSAAVRLQVEDRTLTFNDLFQGEYSQNLAREIGDFVLLRKDNLYAYQLAVVVDDQAQQISHVIRGADLLDSTPRQHYLQQVLGYRRPVYGHVPIIVNAQGEKLSKQTHAPALETQSASANLRFALGFLRQPAPPADREDCNGILDWAIQHWQRQQIPPQLALTG